MTKTFTIGVIGCCLSAEYFYSAAGVDEKFHLKKLFRADGMVPEHISQMYKQAEIVSNIDSILHDESIDLVLLSNDHLSFAKEVINSGKSMRVI